MIKTISDAEWDVMRIVWTYGDVTVDEIAEKIDGKHDWKLPTIKTLLGRLVKKDMLATEKDGRKYIYSAKMSECEAAREMADDFADKICTKQRAAAIAELIRRSSFTEEDIQMLKDTLDEQKASAEVECNCVEE